jgi:hypothetical protein
LPLSLFEQPAAEFFSNRLVIPASPAILASPLILSGHPKPANEGHLKTGQR